MNHMKFSLSVSFFDGDVEVETFTIQPRLLNVMSDDGLSNMQYVAVLLNLLSGALSVQDDVRTVCKLNLLMQVVNL